MWLRTASRADITAIHSLLMETWHATYDDLLGSEPVIRMVSQWHTPEMLQKYLAQPSSEYVVADNGEAICGVAYARQGGAGRQPDSVILHQLYVRPEFQHQGIGSRLLAEIEGCFPAARRVELVIFEKNNHAIQFYLKQGYKITGLPVPAPGYSDINEIPMEKILS